MCQTLSLRAWWGLGTRLTSAGREVLHECCKLREVDEHVIPSSVFNGGEQHSKDPGKDDPKDLNVLVSPPRLVTLKHLYQLT